MDGNRIDSRIDLLQSLRVKISNSRNLRNGLVLSDKSRCKGSFCKCSLIGECHDSDGGDDDNNDETLLLDPEQSNAIQIKYLYKCMYYKVHRAHEVKNQRAIFRRTYITK